MKTLGFAAIFGSAASLLCVSVASAQPPMPASGAHSAPDLAPGRTPAQSAKVYYRDGQLEVIADDSSLNLTLLQIARSTGIRVLGVAAEERVFGTYGPSAPAAIFRSLLQGTGTNMLLTERRLNAPAELLLTLQKGPATPPSSGSAVIDQPTSRVSSAAPVQPLSASDTSTGEHGSSQAEAGSSAAEAPPPPVPLTSGERALFIDRLQQQQRKVAPPH